MIVTEHKRENLWAAMRENDEGLETLNKRFGTVRSIKEVDVKNLLEGKRIIIEHGALKALFKSHTTDLKTHALLAEYRARHRIRS